MMERNGKEERDFLFEIVFDAKIKKIAFIEAFFHLQKSRKLIIIFFRPEKNTFHLKLTDKIFLFHPSCQKQLLFFKYTESVFFYVHHQKQGHLHSEE